MQGRVCASPNTASVDYVARLNRAVDYITGNLDQPLRLEEVARAACFSTRKPDALRAADATTMLGDAEVSITTFAPTSIAEIDIAGTIELELRALDWLYLTWLPGSGYAPAHQPGFEAFNGRPFAHGTEHFELRVQLPIVDARVPL